ncbi:conserved hypothetical protein [Arthrobacter sp. FB24]|uniref:hypothetical protein n=1 Tax=Arthrobacter sp. (strain FB24) TaxID=290399 RepID=UPI0000527C20|nr:hypothetical protein [Arthrobacter sp. FB24]ABK02027.1 conserved hypothetical protein [Arthrobacter sp. FB24]
MRTRHARTPFHSLRAAMVAAMIVTLAAAAHVVGGGDLPAPGIMAAFLALTGMAATAATRCKLNFPAMAALLGTGQLVLHEAFSALSSPAGAAPAEPAGHHPASVPFPGLPLDAAGSAATHLHQYESPWVAGLMLGGHALATLACALLLAKGEAALWSLAAWLRPLVRLPRAAMPDVVAAPAAAGWPEDSAPLPWRNLRADCPRGPPAAVVLS